MKALVVLAALACAALPSGQAHSAAGPVPVPVPVAPPAPSPAVAPGDPLTVEVLTFGPGGHPFTRFGHNAIRVVDSVAGTDVVYNFGTFSFDSPWLIVDFLQGRLRYWLSRSSMAATLHVYQRENRDIETQRLNLTAAQKRELLTRLEVNARPENRDYKYDYFADNCSTRVRDAIDGVLQGGLRASAVGPGGMSLRAHALRMVADDLPLYTALLIVLGPRADRPVDQWAETFLPEMLQRTLRGARVTDPRTATGPLVSAEQVLFADDRTPPRREPPNRSAAFLGVGVVLGAIMFLLGRMGSRFVGARVLFGLVLSVAGLLVGGLGCFLVGAWAFTPHAVVYWNQNVLLLAPFAIAFTVLGLGVALGRPGATRKAFLVAAAALGLTAVACAWKLFPWFRQENGALILLMLPLWWGLTAGVRGVGTTRTPAPSRS